MRILFAGLAAFALLMTPLKAQEADLGQAQAFVIAGGNYLHIFGH